MKKLPKIYQVDINKTICNNKKNCYVENQSPNMSLSELKTILNEVFSGYGYAYNIPLIIKTTKKEYQTTLIAKTKKNIVTIENEVIPISEILSIEKKKNN